LNHFIKAVENDSQFEIIEPEHCRAFHAHKSILQLRMKEFLAPQNFSALAIQPIGSAFAKAGRFPMVQIRASSISNRPLLRRPGRSDQFVKNQELKREEKKDL